MYCSNCKNAVGDDENYCSKCGAYVIMKSRKTNNKKTPLKKYFIVMGIMMFVFFFLLICNSVFGLINKDTVYLSSTDIYYKETQTELVEKIPNSQMRYVKNQLIIIADSDVEKSSVKKIVNEYNGKIVGFLKESGTYQIEFSDNISYEKLNIIKDALEEKSEISSTHLNMIIDLESCDKGYYPNDEQWYNQWITEGSDWKDEWRLSIEGSNWGLEVIQAPYAWQYLRTKSVKDVTIGIFEVSGVNEWHEDLKGVFKKVMNTSDSNVNHGTAVSGIIGAGFDNGTGMCGVVPNAELNYISYYNSENNNLDDVMKYNACVEFLITENRKQTAVVNMSLGIEELSFLASRGNDVAKSDLDNLNDVLAKHLNKLLNRGYDFIIVKGAGNANEVENETRRYLYLQVDESESEYGYVKLTNDNVKKYKRKYKDFEARIEYGNVDAQYDIYSGISDKEIKDRIIVVGAVSPATNKVSGFSCEGDRVDILAPGDAVGVLTKDGYSYDDNWGTSYSAPYVTGVAGLVLSMQPTISGADLKQLLINTSTGEYEGTLNGKTYKHKLVNAYNAVKAAEVITVVLNEDDLISFNTYNEAVKETIKSGSWTEELSCTIDMMLTSSNNKAKTKVNLEARSEIEGYSLDTYDNLIITGNCKMNILNQEYAYDMKYSNGKATYDFISPSIYTKEVDINPTIFDMNSITDDMVYNLKVSGNQMEFIIPGDVMTEKGNTLMGSVYMFQEVSNITYGDVEVAVTIDIASGKINNIRMLFHASMNYQGYDIDSDYDISYSFE